MPINTAKSEISELEKGGTVRGAYLGLTSLTIDGSLSALNLPVQTGCPGAERAEGHGRRKGRHPRWQPQQQRRRRPVAVGGDIIVSIDGKPVTSSEDLANDIAAKKPGDTVSIVLLRAERQRALRKEDVSVKLGSRPNSVPNANTPEG